MDGDRVDVDGLAQLAQRHDALLYLDDAHATGVFGQDGYGLGISNANTVVMGTFSKALGASGAYLACSQTIATYLVNHSTGFIYSTAPAPAAVAAARASWQLLPTLADSRQQLLHNAAQLRQRLQASGFDTGASDTHILPVILGDETRTLNTQKRLLQLGIKVSAIRPPTVPPNTARLRIALSAAHTQEQIEALLQGLGA
jgi:8-amino-7-oxononanoate synthase